MVRSTDKNFCPQKGGVIIVLTIPSEVSLKTVFSPLSSPTHFLADYTSSCLHYCLEHYGSGLIIALTFIDYIILLVVAYNYIALKTMQMFGHVTGLEGKQYSIQVCFPHAS